MAQVILVTSMGRTIEATVGEPITALAEGERVITLQRPAGQAKLSPEGLAWLRRVVYPLMPR